MPESAVDEVEVGRWRYEVVVNTGGYSAFGLRQGPSIDAPRTGEVAINGEKSGGNSESSRNLAHRQKRSRNGRAKGRTGVVTTHDCSS